MKILVLAAEPKLDGADVVTGNALRLHFISQALEGAEHEVTHVWQSPQGALSPAPASDESTAGLAYGSPTGLKAIIKRLQPDRILVSYWRLLEDLPPSRDDSVVILDTVAPRLFEVMYEAPDQAISEAAEMLRAFRRADFFLVGNLRQRQVLLPQLILAGHDCRGEAPIAVVPICGGDSDPEAPARALESAQTLRFVTGGVDWPWRKVEPWLRALNDAIDAQGGAAEIFWYAGRYKLHGGSAIPTNADPAIPHITRLPLVPYEQLPEAFGQAHIGLELSDRNPEREVSQSFRSIEMLRLGLPIICNRYLELATLIEAYDAGWTLETKDQLQELYGAICNDRSIIERKSAGARRLYAEHFHYRPACQSLLQVIGSLRPRTPGPGLADGALASPVQQSRGAAANAWMARGMTRAKPRIMQGLRWGLGKLRRRQAGRGIVMISRDDIFPPNHGAAVKIHHTAMGLARLVDHVFLVTDRADCYYSFGPTGFEERRLPFWLRFLAPPKRWVHGRLVRKGYPQGGDLFLYEAVADYSFISRTLYLAVRFPIKAFIAEFPGYARAAIWGRALLDGDVMLVEHNVEYERLRAQYKSLSAESYDLLKGVEIAYCERADVVICVSENDRERLIADGVSPGRIAYVPHGVDLDEFGHKDGAAIRARYNVAEGQPLLVYHGAMIYPPNLEAVTALAEEILPRLRAKGLRPKILAIGRNPPDVSPDPDVIFTGPVDALGEYLSAADLAAVFLKEGGGTRMKILDYFAAQVPVVSTTKGIEGIPVAVGQEAIIEDDYDAFAEAILSLWNDKTKAKAQAERAFAFVESLGWPAIAERYAALLPSLKQETPKPK